MRVLAIIVFVNLHGDLVGPMSAVVPTVHQCHMWQHEQALKHADLGEPLFYCVNNHGRHPRQPSLANDDPREIRG